MAFVRRWTSKALIRALVLLFACDKSGGTPPAESSGQARESTVSSAVAGDGKSSETNTDYPGGTCLDLQQANPHPVNSFWNCSWWCGISTENDVPSLAPEQSRMSYDLLEPGEPDGCFELRTALYECFDALTCAEVEDFGEAADAGTDGPCVTECFVLEPHIPECGI